MGRNSVQLDVVKFLISPDVFLYWPVSLTETASSTKSSGDDNQNAQPEELPSESVTALSRNVQEDTERSGLKETQGSAKYTGDSVGLDYIKTQKRGKEDQFESQPTLEQPHITSHVKDDFTGSSPVNVEGVLLKEAHPSCEQRLAAQNENYSKFNFVLVSQLNTKGPLFDNTFTIFLVR